MLGSLLKYDFRALNKQMIPLQIAVLAAGILGTVCMNIGIRTITTSYSYSYYSAGSSAAMFEVFLESMSILAAVVLFSLVFLSGFISLVLVARHVYANFYSSEGYLTFTLPITVDRHLWSKVISGTVWLVVNTIIIIFSCILLFVFGFSTEGLVSTEIVQAFGNVFYDAGPHLMIIFLIELVLISILSLAMSVLQVIFSVVLGGALARTHKVLAGIGVYILSGMAYSTILSIFTFVTTMELVYSTIDYSSTSWFIQVQPTLIVTALISIGFGVLFYFISRKSLKNSLNLD